MGFIRMNVEMNAVSFLSVECRVIGEKEARFRRERMLDESKRMSECVNERVDA